MSEDKLWLSEAMQKFNKKLRKGVLNIVNAPAGSGKSTFIFKDLIHESWKYVEDMKEQTTYAENLDRVLYVTDTTMLKDSILQSNKNTTKVLEKGDLAKAVHSKNETEIEDMINGFAGKIKVITYSTLGWLLQNEKARYCLLHFNLVIFDEMQNLFKYANRFDTKEHPLYKNVIGGIDDFLFNDTLLVALSATTGRIYNGLREAFTPRSSVFISKELNEIRRYSFEYEGRTNNMWNIVKRICVEKKRFKNKTKIFIYTNTINRSKKFKDHLEKFGYKTEWLCSINNKTTNEDGEKIPTMSEAQLELREKLLLDGTLPDDLDVLIVNSGYETGWNLYDERVQVALIDTTDVEEQIQAKNRIRHDITDLYITVMTTDEGEIRLYNKYREKINIGEQINEYGIARFIEPKYIGVRLSKEDKRYLIDNYASYRYDEDSVNWQTFKKDLNAVGLTAITDKTGTYIYRKGTDKNMENENKLIDWLENEWDKKRITIADVKDILDLGTHTFNKLLENANIVKYMKDHRYKIGVPKGTKSKYLMKY